MKMRILVIGAGYVGLSTGVFLSEKHEVLLLDVDPKKVSMINNGKSHIYEVGIDELLQKQVADNRLKALLPDDDVGRVDAVFVCVGTPSSNDGSVDLSQVEGAADFILARIEEMLDDYMVIIMKSTVPPGTTRKKILDKAEECGLDAKIGVVFCPEFLREGSALADIQNPDRIVIGCNKSREYDTVKRIYSQALGEGVGTFVETTLESAELCKYVSNSFLALKISFANEIANIAEMVNGVDIDQVMKCVGLDSRISPKFFGSGAGYGGSCFPKDTSGLRDFARKLNVDTPILRAANEVNQERPDRLVKMLEEMIGNVSNRKIAVLGIAFKPGTDDTRYSPAINVINILKEKGANVYAHDPFVDRMDHVLDEVGDATITGSIEECVLDSEGTILVTDWPIYKEMGIEKIMEYASYKSFVDGRRLFAGTIIPVEIDYRTTGTYHK
jgi:UDPglucose 6-dehydrogenase